MISTCRGRAGRPTAHLRTGLSGDASSRATTNSLLGRAVCSLRPERHPEAFATPCQGGASGGFPGKGRPGSAATRDGPAEAAEGLLGRAGPGGSPPPLLALAVLPSSEGGRENPSWLLPPFQPAHIAAARCLSFCFWQMGEFTSRLCLLLVPLLPVYHLPAQSGPGHMIASAIAYRDMSPKDEPGSVCRPNRR